MAKLHIIGVGSPVLHTKAKPVAHALFNTPELRELIADMKETMRAGGVGLAAPQINVPLRIIVLEDRADYIRKRPTADMRRQGRKPFVFRAIINPSLRVIGKRTAVEQEGCLSVPGIVGQVKRAWTVEVSGFRPDGKRMTWRVSGWPARILQHEIDHLEGVLYLEKAVLGTIRPSGDAMDEPLDTGARLARRHQALRGLGRRSARRDQA